MDELLLEVDESIDDADDEDVFSVDLARGVDYEVTVLGEEGLDPLVKIFDEDGELVLSDDDSLLGPDPYLQFTVPFSGTYDVVVSDPDEGTGDYTLLLGESDAPLIA
jgi:hypothetical protein